MCTFPRHELTKYTLADSYIPFCFRKGLRKYCAHEDVIDCFQPMKSQNSVKSEFVFPNCSLAQLEEITIRVNYPIQISSHLKAFPNAVV